MPTVRWLGKAQDIQQVDTHTFSGSPEATDIVTVTCNTKALILTLGTDVTLASVAAETAAMINAKNATAGLLGTPDETRNFGGQQIPEFTEVVASSSGAVLTIKSTAGVPVTITVAVTQVGATSSIAVSSATPTAATGKNFFNNAANWEGGSLPSNGDTVLFDQGAVDVKYGLNEASAITDLSLRRTNAYTGNIGLPATNPLGYVEYRTRFLQLPASAAEQSLVIGNEDQTLTPQGYTYIDWGATSAVGLYATIYSAPAYSQTTGYPVQIVRGDTMQLEVRGNSGVWVGCDRTKADTGMNAVRVYGNADVLLDEDTVLEADAAVIQTGGKLYMNGTVAGTGNPTVVVYGGETHIVSGNMLSILIHAGATVEYSGGSTATTVTVYSGGVLTEGLVAATITNMTVYRGATLTHPNDKLTFTNGIDFSGCRPSEITWTAPLHKTWTPTAI